ncbi:MAG: phosphoglycerate dehydrogenase [Peptococcaceae bacterium]|jgi:D-3-phosphoglycerate dehydrogenase|nr:phosphoglycerate dehydrogenase [Peptococcaceae bacterium]
MKKILVTIPEFQQKCAAGFALLREKGYEVVETPLMRPYSPEEMAAMIGDFDGAITDLEIWDEKLFAVAAKLKIVSRFGVGMDNFDLAAAKRHGVIITNCPGVNSSAVAEQAIALIMALLRQVPRYDTQARRGDWSRPCFQEIAGKTVGILGFGAIGRLLAKKLAGFEVTLLAYDKFPNEQAARELSVTLTGLDEALSASDIISIHLPSLPETAHIIDSDTIAKMRHGVLLVNTARGALVNEAAVAQALRSGKIGGMASDVFEVEPVSPDNPLFAFDNFIAAPHVSSDTAQNFDRTGLMVAEAVSAALSGQTPLNALC